MIRFKKSQNETKSYTISTGDINAPIQIQQDSRYSSRVQKIKQSSESIDALFSLIRKYRKSEQRNPWKFWIRNGWCC